MCCRAAASVTYRIELTASAKRALEVTLPQVSAVACGEVIRGPLADNPHRVGKLLRDQLSGRFSARRGEFRKIYQIFEDRIVVRIINIDHPRNVYR